MNHDLNFRTLISDFGLFFLFLSKEIYNLWNMTSLNKPTLLLTLNLSVIIR